MGEKLRDHLTYANVVSTLCLFVLLGGGAYAASQVGRNSVGSRQVTNGSLKSADVKDQNLKGADIKNDSLTGADIDESTLSLPQSTRTTRAGDVVTVPANGTSLAAVNCPAGERPTGGGGLAYSNGVYLTWSAPSPTNAPGTPTGWVVNYANTTTAPATVQAEAICEGP